MSTDIFKIDIEKKRAKNGSLFEGSLWEIQGPSRLPFWTTYMEHSNKRFSMNLQRQVGRPRLRSSWIKILGITLSNIEIIHIEYMSHNRAPKWKWHVDRKRTNIAVPSICFSLIMHAQYSFFAPSKHCHAYLIKMYWIKIL